LWHDLDRFRRCAGRYREPGSPLVLFGGCSIPIMSAPVRLLAIVFLSVFVFVLAEPAKVAGKWNASLQLESITGHPVLEFKQDGEKLTGTYTGRYGESALEGTIKENKIQFSVTFVAEGTQTQGIFAGTVEGDTMSGTVEFEGAGDGTWSATRVKP
jgi:hypothetical protein